MYGDAFDSERLTTEFYRQLGHDRLGDRTRAEWDERIANTVMEVLPPQGAVLDVGCGYGRVSLPLARAGFDVTGLDLSPDLIDAARQRARSEAIEVDFILGSMTELPFDDCSFDAVVCLWSAFNELLNDSEQVQTLREMSRVLRPTGFTLIEGPLFTAPTEEEIAGRARRGPENRISWDVVEGILNPHFVHDEASLNRLCAKAGISHYRVFEQEWGGRGRLLLRFEK